MGTTWNDLVDTTLTNYDRICSDFIAKMPDVQLDNRIAITTGVEFSRLAAAEAVEAWLGTPKKLFAFLQDIRDEDEDLFDEIVLNVPEEMADDTDLVDLDEVNKTAFKAIPAAVAAQWAEVMRTGLAQTVADDMEVQQFVGTRFQQDLHKAYGQEQFIQAFVALCEHSPHGERIGELMGALRFGNGTAILNKALAMMEGMEQPEERRWADGKAIDPYVVNAVWCAYNWTEFAFEDRDDIGPVSRRVAQAIEEKLPSNKRPEV